MFAEWGRDKEICLSPAESQEVKREGKLSFQTKREDTEVDPTHSEKTVGYDSMSQQRRSLANLCDH